MCALAAAPSDHLLNLIITLKLVLAHKEHVISPGSKVGILDMMTRSNDMFVEAMKGFPKCNKPVAKPYHHSIGHDLTIVSDGITSLSDADVGKMQPFLDINKAKSMGMCGPDPVLVWHDAEWQALVDNLCAGLVFTKDSWDDIEYCKTTWSDATAQRTKAPQMHRNNLRILKDRAQSPNVYNEFIRQQPNFEACEVLPETSTVPPADDQENQRKLRY